MQIVNNYDKEVYNGDIGRIASIDEEAREVKVIIDDFSTPQQVFRIPLSRKPKVQDWSQWQRPDFLATGDVGWAFIYKRKIQGVITNIPPDSFELRYKVEMQ